MPVAAYIAVRVVPVGHVLGMGDVHHVADDAGVDQLLELAVEFGIAHHMADHDLRALFLGAALQVFSSRMLYPRSMAWQAYA